MKKIDSKKIKKEWDFSMFYKGKNDPNIEKDLMATERAYASFARKYEKNDSYLKSAHKLAQACRDYETLLASPKAVRPYAYFGLLKIKNSSDDEVTAKLTKVDDRLTNAGNKLVFFKLSLGKIPPVTQKQYLKHSALMPYRYFLEKVFARSKYHLPEGEEKLLSLVSTPAYDMWRNAFDKLLSNQVIEFEGKKMPINEALGQLSQLPTKERRLLDSAIAKQLKEVAFLAEAEINAIYNLKKIKDEVRGYDKPYSAMIIGNEDDIQVVERLVDTVQKYYRISHRFYKAKAKILKLKKLTYADRVAPVGTTTRKYSFDETVEILRSAFSKVGDNYVKTLDQYLQKGQVDVFPKKGKQGGAFCWGNTGIPTVVMLNHTNSFASVTTFAHEMGHAFHTELSKGQPTIYQSYTTSVAEVASTLFENFAFDEVFKTLTEEEKVVALHDKINNTISTIMRQIACFSFELDLHQKIREEGYVSSRDIATCLNKHMSAYLGPIVKMKENDGYFFTNWSHIRRHFYVYTYAFGELVSRALYSKYKKDRTFMKDIEKFLSAGGSMPPKDIFKSIGIDISDPKFFEDGLLEIEAELKELEKLIR